MLPNPYALLAGVLALAAAVGGAYVRGHSDGVDTQRSADLVERSKLLARQMAMSAALNLRERAITERDAAAQARVVTQFKTIEKEVIRYAVDHRNAPECLDAGGLRLWRAAAAGDAAQAGADATVGQPAVAGGPAGARDGERARPAGELQPGGAALSQPANALSHPGGVGAGRARASR